MRKTIGKRLLESKQQIPHYQVSVEINMGEPSRYGAGFQLNLIVDRIMKLRELFNKAGEGRSKLSVNDFSELCETSHLAISSSST